MPDAWTELRDVLADLTQHVACRPEDVERVEAALVEVPGFFRVIGDKHVPVGQIFTWCGDPARRFWEETHGV